MTARPPGPILARLFRLPALLYRWNAGWLLGRRCLQLTHVGRRTGRHYRTVLEVVGVDAASDEVMVVAGFGRSTDWYRNLQAHPAVEITIGRHRFRPLHRELDESAAVAVMADYERRNRLITPVIRRGLSWLVGWRYDGSDEARRKLVQELPVLAFQPVDHTDQSPPAT